MPKPYRSRAEYYYGALTEGYEGELPRPQSREDAYLLKLIDQMSSQSGKATFTPRGSVQNVSNLPSLDSAQAGDIYNIQTDSKTTADFVEGAGVTIKGGTNVYCVLNSDNAKKWDAFGSTYAVDYALDPSSGHPLANNAVCAAIDNVTDQLNPAFVERIKTIHIPSMPVGTCCKIMSIENHSSDSWIILDMCMNFRMNGIDTVQLRFFDIGIFTQIGKPSETIEFKLVKDGDTQYLYAVNYDDTDETYEMFVDAKCVAGQINDNANGKRSRITLISDPILENTADVDSKVHSSAFVSGWSYDHADNSSTGGFSVVSLPYGRSYITGGLTKLSCKAGEIIAINSDKGLQTSVGECVIPLIDSKSFKVYHAYMSYYDLTICEDCTADVLRCRAWVPANF